MRYADNRSTNAYTDIQAHRLVAKKMILGFRGASKHINLSKFSFQKFDSKTILSLHIGKRKLKENEIKNSKYL